jgi:hypothetical protein
VHNPLSDEDCSALLHLLTVVEVTVDAAPDGLVARHTREGLVACCLLAADDPIRELSAALAQLQVRYRFSLGEYTERTTGRAAELAGSPSCADPPGVPTGE